MNTTAPLRLPRTALFVLLAFVLGAASAGACRPRPRVATKDGTGTPSVTGTGAAGYRGVGGEGAQPGTGTAVFETRVYFSEEGDRGERLVAVTRSATAAPASAAWTAERKLDWTLRQWLKGPTAAEKKRGLRAGAAAGTKLLGVSVAGDVATVDLSSAFEPAGGSAAIMNALGQLVYTATAVPPVRAVRLKLAGEAVQAFGGEGFDTSKPLSRPDVASYFVP